MLSKKELEKIDYVNLHLHTHFSILDGVGTVKDHISECIRKGHKGVCITDHGVMSGCIQLYKLSKDKDFLQKLGQFNQIPIVMGSELYITQDVSTRDMENKYNHITVMAKNNQGYRNLCELTSIGSKDDHFYSRPRIGLNELFAKKEGLVVTSGCFIGMIPQAIHRGTGKEEEILLKFKEEFGDDFYVEIHLSNINKKWDKTLKKHIEQPTNPQEKVNLRLIELARKHNVKMIICQDSHMPKKEHHFIQSIMIWNSPSGKDGWHFPDAYYTMSVEDMYAKCKENTPYISDQEFIEGCNNTIEILNKCKDINLQFSPKLPKIEHEQHSVNKIESLDKKLEILKESFSDIDPEFSKIITVSESDLSLRTALKIVLKNKKIDLTDDTYRKRLTLELETIQRNGVLKLVDYFLLLEDVTGFVRSNGYMKGPGRGSAAGSLFAYALDITDVDPIKFGLLFSRFLAKERIGTMEFKIPEAD
jgi:DNA polymerase-3 subunit alpha